MYNVSEKKIMVKILLKLHNSNKKRAKNNYDFKSHLRTIQLDCET